MNEWINVILLKQRWLGKLICWSVPHRTRELLQRMWFKNCWLLGWGRGRGRGKGGLQTVNPVTNVVMICGGTGSPTVFSLYSSPKEGSSELRLALHHRDRWAVIFIVFWCRSFCLSHWWKVATESESSWHQNQKLLWSHRGGAPDTLWHDQMSKSCSTLNRTRSLYFPVGFMWFTE